MAGTVTVTENRIGPVKKITWSWTSDGSGDADKLTTYTYNGKVITLVTDPGATAPTDNYDIAINDADGVDVLVGAGANRDTANTELVAEALLGAVASSTLNLVVTNAGAAKVGTVHLYIR